MAKQEEYQRLLASFRTIRDERGVAQNTAVRIGTAFIELLRFALTGEFDEITFNKVLNKPTFMQGLITLGTIVLGEYSEGLKGGIITPEGAAELKELWVRQNAKLGDGQIHRDEAGKVIPALEVKGDSTFSGNLSSPEFVSAFFGGQGWCIKKKEVKNAAGEIEIKYYLEIDEITVRNTLRVFEMIISQLLGENGNRFFSDMMEVDHYDPETGRVLLKTNGGRLYNPFRKDDIVYVQQYNGDPNADNNWYVTKAYELHITAVGLGNTGDGVDRKDWVEFDNFTTQMEGGTPESLIKEFDTFVRADNLTNEQRKGLLSFMSVGQNTPYMDIIYGQKTDPKHALKGRTGNLTGIRTDVFGWLEGFGAYMNNFYGVGKFVNAQTGESHQARIEMALKRFGSVYKETTYNISNDDNFLLNGFFQNGLDPWTVCNADGTAPAVEEEGEILGVGGVPLMVNGEMITVRQKTTAKIEEMDGIQVLHLRAMGVSQPFSGIKVKGTHKEMASSDQSSTQMTDTPDTMYLGVRILPVTSGTLRVCFLKDNGGYTDWQTEIEDSINWQLYQAQDSVAMPWDWTGTGKCIVSYTGECYLRFVALLTSPVNNLKDEYSTLIEQTSRKILLEAARQDSNLNTAVAALELEYDHLQTTVTNNKTAADNALATLTTNLNTEVNARTSLENTYKATWVYQNDSLLTLMAAQFNSDGTIIGYAGLQVSVGNLQTTVTNNKTAADNAFATLNNTTIPALSNRITTAQSKADDAYSEGHSAASWISQHEDSVLIAAAAFNASGKLINTSGLVTTSGFASLFTTNMTNNGVITSANISVYTSDFVDEGDVNTLISIAQIEADQINWEFTKTTSWYAKNGSSKVKVMELDNVGNLWIKGQIASGSVISDGTQNYAASSVLNQFKAYPITVTGSSTYLSLANGNIQAIIKSTFNGEKNVYLPTLGDMRSVLGIPSSDTRDFCVTMKIINQARMSGTTYDVDNLDIIGGTHDYSTEITSISTRPRIMRGTDENWFQLEAAFSAVIFITYINKRFIANWIKG